MCLTIAKLMLCSRIVDTNSASIKQFSLSANDLVSESLGGQTQEFVTVHRVRTRTLSFAHTSYYIYSGRQRDHLTTCLETGQPILFRKNMQTL